VCLRFWHGFADFRELLFSTPCKIGDCVRSRRMHCVTIAGILGFLTSLEVSVAFSTQPGLEGRFGERTHAVHASLLPIVANTVD
jgi:hypothetical protein